MVALGYFFADAEKQDPRKRAERLRQRQQRAQRGYQGRVARDWRDVVDAGGYALADVLSGVSARKAEGRAEQQRTDAVRGVMEALMGGGAVAAAPETSEPVTDAVMRSQSAPGRQPPMGGPTRANLAAVDALARTIYGEAAGEGLEGMLAAGHVVMNRVADQRWPNDVVGVVKQPKQFSAWNSPDQGGNDLVNIPLSDPRMAEAKKAAQSLVLGQAGVDPTGGATHYYSPKGMQALKDQGVQSHLVPRWHDQVAAEGAPRTIGNHVFLGQAQGVSPTAPGTPASAARPTPPARPSRPPEAFNTNALLEAAMAPGIPDALQGSVMNYILNERRRQNDPLAQARLELERDKLRFGREQLEARRAGGGGGGQQFTLKPGEVRYVPDGQGGFRTIEGPEDPTVTRRAQQSQRTGDIVTQSINDALGMLEDGVFSGAGATGAIMSLLPGSEASNLRAALDTIGANISFQALNEMRQASPTGGALGNVTERELQLLQATLGNLSPWQDGRTLARNLRRVQTIFDEIVHGPGGKAGNTSVDDLTRGYQ